jgi:predicted ArsR family transcriptional regulator
LTQGILGLEGDFTIRDVSERVGGSPLTVKNTLGMLEAQGKITPAGERSGSRGRAARAWTVTSPS